MRYRDSAAERYKAKADMSLGVVVDQFMAEHVSKLKPATVAVLRLGISQVLLALSQRESPEVLAK